MELRIDIPQNVGIPEFGGSGQSVSSLGSPDTELKRLRMKNEAWTKYSPLWDFYLSSYEGGTDFANQDNLFRHQRENQEDFNDRAKRVHNLNYCEPIVDFFTNFIFSEAIDRGGGSDKSFYLDFTKNVNKRGDGIDDFMRHVSDDSQIFGMSYVIVDSPQTPDQQLSKQDELDLGVRPYWVLVKPTEIIDWVVDEFGVFEYVKRMHMVDQLIVGVHKRLERYTEFYLDHIDISDVDPDAIDPKTKRKKPAIVRFVSVPNSVGVIPITTVRYKRSKREPHIGLSFLRDFAFNNREIMNLTSLLQEFLYRQAFNILAKEVEGGVPLKEQEDGIVGTSNVMEVPKGAHMPEYITPPSAPAQFIADERAKITNEMFKRAAQDALTELFNGEKASGFSQAQSFSKTVPFISSRADTLERAENDLMVLTYKFLGKTWDGKVKYKDRYELTNLTDALVQLQMLVRDFQLPSPTFIKEELKRMIREYDGKLPVDVLTKIEAEVDAMDMKSWMAIQEQAFAGPKGTSPTAQQKPKDTMTIRESAGEAKVKTAATVALKE
jgi:hypothetical protein